MRLTPATSGRPWMDTSRERFAYRCLPLLIANQAGWFVLNSHAFRATWTGSEDASGVLINYLSGSPPYPITSHFGHGIITWNLLYLFRTPPGYNLLVRGPANWPKDGAYALEGIVETDWCAATFTMNWKLPRANQPVTFEIDEPFCMIVPQKRGELEAFNPIVRSISTDPETARGYGRWVNSRSSFLADLKVPGSEAAREGWQRHYFLGTLVGGTRALAHQTKLKLREFVHLDHE
jgi:hypothetical protein